MNKSYIDVKAEVKIYILIKLLPLYRLTKIIHGIWSKWHEKLGKDHVRIVWNTCTAWRVSRATHEEAAISLHHKVGRLGLFCFVFPGIKIGLQYKRWTRCLSKILPHLLSSGKTNHLSFILMAFLTTGIWLAGGGPSSINSFSGSYNENHNCFRRNVLYGWWIVEKSKRFITFVRLMVATQF